MENRQTKYQYITSQSQITLLHRYKAKTDNADQLAPMAIKKKTKILQKKCKSVKNKVLL